MKKPQKRKRKMFYKLLCSSFAMFIIPFATIIILFITTSGTIRDEIMDNASNSMDSFVYSMDSVFSEMENIVMQVSMHNTVTSYASRGVLPNPTYGTSVYQVQQVLKGYTSAPMEDVFIYYEANDLVISRSKSCVQSALFYQAYFSTNAEGSNYYFDSYDAMQQWLRVCGENTRQPTLISFVDCAGSTHLAVSYARQISGNTRFTVIALIKPDEVARILNNVSESGDHALMLYDRNSQRLACTDGTEINSPIPEFSSDGAYQTVKVGGTEYVFMQSRSDVMDCTYVSAVPSLVVLKKLTQITRISIIGVSLCLLFSVLFAFGLSKANYRPIESLISTFSRKSGIYESKQMDDEIGFINLVLNRSMEQCELLEKQQKLESMSIQESFWLHALQGAVVPDKNHNNENLFKDAGIHLKSDAFGVILVHVDRASADLVANLTDPDSQQIIGLIIDNVLTELCGQKHIGYVMKISTNRFAAVVNFSIEADTAECSADMKEAAVLFSDFASRKCGLETTLAWSEVHRGLAGIHTGLLQAESAMEYRFIEGEGSLIAYASIANRGFSYNSAVDSDATQLLLRYVRANEEKEPELPLPELLQNARVCADSSLETVNCYKFDIIGAVNKIILGIGASSLNRENDLLKKLFESDTLEHFQLQLADTMRQLRIFALQSEERTDLCAKVRDYIETHYMDADLNNSMIADTFHISAGYLSKLFRLQNSVSMLDLLNQTRILHAKQLLHDRDLNINDIASATGFLGAPAFIKAFKKQEGITPGGYRKLIQVSDTDR